MELRDRKALKDCAKSFNKLFVDFALELDDKKSAILKNFAFEEAREMVEIIDEQANPDDELCISWHAMDVLQQCPLLTLEEAREVLRYLDKRLDHNFGVTWETIDVAINELYPEKVVQYAEMQDNGECLEGEETYWKLRKQELANE